MMREEPIILNLEDEIRTIIEEISCTRQEAEDFVYLEDAYYDMLGLNVYGEEPALNNLVTNVVVEMNDMHRFIVEHSSVLDMSMCEQIQKVEDSYYEKIGLCE